MSLDERSVQYVAESHAARLERSNRRMFILCVILIVALLTTNGLWFWYESQFETVSTSVEAEQDGSGVNIVGAGDVVYGAESTSNGQKASAQNRRQLGIS